MPGEPRALEIGKGELLREGDEGVLMAIGSTVYPALAAADRLEKIGVRVAVINARFLKPLDEELVCFWAGKTGRVLTVEENALQGGFGSAVLELLQQKQLCSVAVRRLGIPDLFVEHGPQSLLRRIWGIDEEGILDAMRSMVGEKPEETSSFARSEPSIVSGALSGGK
jgi:1-deoxy-D-xylulose-5-phosphate synthase